MSFLLFAIFFFQNFQANGPAQLEPIKRLAQQASSIQLAECLSIKSQWNEKHTKIITVANFLSQETLKGVAQHEFEVSFLGGTLDKISQIAVGLPFPKVGERALLFLGSTQEDGSRRLLGGSLGLIPVKETDHGPTFQIYLANVESQAEQVSEAMSLPLEALLAQLRSQH